MLRELFIIMIHGTWGRGIFPSSRALIHRQPRWYEPGSGFHNDLVSQLNERGIEVQASFIKWSGANSFKGREFAAKKLAEAIDLRAKQFPNVPILLLGHSHGGNVISHALSHTTNLDRIYTASLATPFLEVFKTELTPAQSRALYTLYFFSFIVVVALFNITVDYFLPHLRRNPGLHIPNIIAAIGAVVLGIVASILVCSWILRKSAAQIELIERISSQVDASHLGARRLVVRAIDDEATLTITTGAIGTRLASLALSLIGAFRPNNLIWLALPLCLIFAATQLPIETKTRLYLRELEQVYMFAYLGLLPFLVFLLVVLAAAFRAFCGRELALAGVNCEVSAHSAPDGQGVDIVTLRQDGAAKRILRHYIYEHPGCVPALVDWIASRPT
ncbi:hypothetical protein IVB38_29160 [Bradyrhizobium sp. 38]|uniref:hypothetical protein n=1 Tax=unclassified Bradyrhizobium TaxID=2631580 RepID=UPI001FFA02BF|nr:MULTISPECIES: hypothetical protein [unclassified Bradyrhizobium]MCK1339964.1 hypothetical protein [Bradyrhizobium sp. 38]MCK1782178.1 hypothetical protein [Bradyrhizobium sp. 132]